MALGSRLRSGIGTIWRGISSAVRQGVSVFDFSSRTAQVAEGLGLPSPVSDTSVVDQLAGMAQGMESATAAWRDAPGDALIDPSMVSLAPWSADLNTFNADPRYWAHVELLVQAEDGTISSQWRYITGLHYIEMTKDQLSTILRLNAYQFIRGTTEGGGIEGTLAGIGDVTLSVAPAGL